MSSAAYRNFVNANANRDRRVAAQLDNPGMPQVSAGNDLAWDAFYGGLHNVQDRAAQAGLGFGVDYGGVGNGASLAGMGRQQQSIAPPPDYLTGKTNATNLALSQIESSDEPTVRARAISSDLAQRDAAAKAAEQAQREQASQLADQEEINQGLDRAQPGATRDQIMAALPGHLRPAVQAHFDAQDAAQQKIAESKAKIAEGEAKTKLEQSKFDATYGTGKDENGQPIASPLAKQIAEYRVPPPSPRTLTSDAGRALMAQIAQLNPAYDASQFPARNKMRMAFTSGPQSQTLNSLNTAIEHLDQFKNAAEALGNGNFKPGNAAYNWVKEQFGSSAPTNFDGMKTIMSGELASAFKKSGATDQEIASVKGALDRANSPQQIADYVTKVAIPALGSKAGTYQAQWEATMGKGDKTFQAYTPGALSVLQKYGAMPSASGAPAAGGSDAAARAQALIKKYGG